MVTGSSGYVSSDLIPRLKERGEVYGFDLLPSGFTNINVGIETDELKTALEELGREELNIVNLAAARFDYGATAEDYYRLNVECHAKFLDSLKVCRIKKFIHISSVASFEGREIDYSNDLNCDDAYRSTKYLQEVAIQKWCNERDIELTILYPSAIFSDNPRPDTNIGKLQSVSKLIPFIPKIEVIKSLTYLPFFSQFIIDLVAGEISAGKYLTIEKPSLTVSKMIQIMSGHSIKLIYVPFFSVILKIIANFLYVLSFFGKIDLKLTPNRVIKLFSDTSYNNVKNEDIDKKIYASRNCEKLPEILLRLIKDRKNG